MTVSHEHPDHNNINVAGGSPLILRGVAGNDWVSIDQEVKGVRVRTVSSYHDEKLGTQRGKNAIFVFDVEGMKIAHLGDLGHQLDSDQVKSIGRIDVLMIPVGGGPTINPKLASVIVGQLSPRVIIPMHYRTDALPAASAARFATVQEFIDALGTGVEVKQAGKTVMLSQAALPAVPTILVMNFK